jgi:hypothetical protein
VTASTLTDGQATISNNVVTASTLTDGQATISNNVVTAATLTDGEAIISSNIITASEITDGEATITGNQVTASVLTDGQATMTGNVVTASVLTDGQATITSGNLIVQTVNINSSTQSSSTTSGSMIVSGGVGISKNLNVGGTTTIQGNCNVIGNFTVSGNTDLLNVTDLLVDDNKIILNANTIGSPLLDAFLCVDRGNETNANIKWNENQNQWEIPNFPLVTGNTLSVSDTTESSNVTSGAFTVMGGVGIVKDLYVGGNIYGNIDSANNTVTSSSVSIDSDEIRLGSSAGQTNQGLRAVAVGGSSGVTNQGSYSVAMGWASGYSNQGKDSIAIGRDAGNTSQGTSCIAIGKNAGRVSQSDNTICLNATGSTVSASANSSACYIAPIREDTSGNGNGKVLYYDNTTKEVHQSNVGFSLLNGNSYIDSNTLTFRKQNTKFGTTLDVRGTLILGNGYVSSLPSMDGAIYRYDGQFEMMFDDNFYMRDKQNKTIHFMFSTKNGFFLPKGTDSTKTGSNYGFKINTDGSNDRVVIHQIENGGGGYWYWNRSFNNGKISDIRMKENINDIEQADLDFLMNIRPRKYKLVDSPEDCCQYGVVAQEILPHILNDSQKNIIHNYDEYVNGDETKLLGVSYISFVPLLIKHNQQQQASIEELQATVTTLQEENASLKQRLENIEKFLNMV